MLCQNQIIWCHMTSKYDISWFGRSWSASIDIQRQLLEQLVDPGGTEPALVLWKPRLKRGAVGIVSWLMFTSILTFAYVSQLRQNKSLKDVQQYLWCLCQDRVCVSPLGSAWNAPEAFWPQRRRATAAGVGRASCPKRVRFAEGEELRFERNQRILCVRF